MTPLFTAKLAIVTGGSSGIGKATALAFAQQGAKVVVTSRREEEGQNTVHLIKEAGGEALFIKTDVSKSADVQNMVNRTIDHFGALDFAFNNAGISGSFLTPLLSYDESTWDDVIDINLKGVFLSMKYELPHILKTKGAIVNMASTAGLKAGAMGVAYYASKHGVVGMTKAVAFEYATQGVRINAVAPAIIETDMTSDVTVKGTPVYDRILARHPMGRFGQPEEVANAVLFLCSPAASYMTGHILPIDGGFMI